MKAGAFYAADLPNVSFLKSELHNWYTKWTTVKETDGLIVLPAILYSTLPNFHPNIKALITVHCTLPVTSCAAERSFSRLIKTSLRSSMSNERHTSLILLHVHQDIPINIEVIQEFARRCPRRIQLS